MTAEHNVEIGALELDCGETLPAVVQRVTLYGTPAADGKNVVLVTHALTGSSRIADWWPDMIGPGGVFDPRECCIAGINALGSCYGSTGPVDLGTPFPRITVGDIVRAQARALHELGIRHLSSVIGGSLGGMQALQWALDYPCRVNRVAMVGAHDHFGAMGIAYNAVQREAIALDSKRGLRLARKIAMLTYKSDALFAQRHGRRRDRFGQDRFDIEGYLDYQAGAFESRMNPASYVALTHAMDSFDVRDLAGSAAAAGDLPALAFVGIRSDRLFLASDVRAAAERFARAGYPASYAEVDSDHGHDAFLAEPKSLGELLLRINDDR